MDVSLIDLSEIVNESLVLAQWYLLGNSLLWHEVQKKN